MPFSRIEMGETMQEQFQKDKDIRITYRQDMVKKYMSPDIQLLQPHFHYLFEMIVVETGWVDFTVAKTCYHLEAGSILFISNLENHSIAGSSDDYSRYSILISNDCLTTLIKSPLLLSIFKQRPDNFRHKYQCVGWELQNILNLCKLMFQEYTRQQPFWDSLLMTKLYGILVRLYRVNPSIFPASQNPEGQNMIFDVQNYISSHLADELNLETVAERFYISKFYLSHRFKEVTGYNFKQYIILERISKSKDMLLNGALPINEISEQVGVHSATHFIRTFKKMEGVSPYQYRKAKLPNRVT